MSPTCSTCRFGHLGNPRAAVECRFNPPTLALVDGVRETAFPLTELDDWCGKYEPDTRATCACGKVAVVIDAVDTREVIEHIRTMSQLQRERSEAIRAAVVKP